MNILFLIGNGFDINLGMATSYRDFYKHYLTLSSPSITIQNLKKGIKEDIENWSDLEKELGDYTKKLNFDNEFTEIYEDLCDRLAEYLETEEEKFDINNFDRSKLSDYLSFPEKSLPPADKLKVTQYKRNWSQSKWNINIITFNYTKILEKILVFNDQAINLGDNNGNAIILQKIEHIHGFLNERMVMGVNDISQISNIEFQKNNNVLIDLVKPECNKVQKHLVDESCKNLILTSQLIIIFGSSIGDTDKLWWELIGEQLKRDCNLVIYDKTNTISTRRPQRKTISETEKINVFLNKTKLNEEEKEQFREKVFVGVNTNMFDIKI